MPMNVPAQEAIKEFLLFLQMKKATLKPSSEGQGFLVYFPRSTEFDHCDLYRIEEYLTIGGYPNFTIEGCPSGVVLKFSSKEED